LGRQVDERLDGLGFCQDAFAQHRRIAAGGFGQAGQHADGRGLAGPVDPQQAKHLALLDREVK
jgi:hypothetical protein